MHKLIVLATLLISAQTTLADINSEIINAATDGQVEAVQILVNAGVDVDEYFDNGMTALMLMAMLTAVLH